MYPKAFNQGGSSRTEPMAALTGRLTPFLHAGPVGAGGAVNLHVPLEPRK